MCRRKNKLRIILLFLLSIGAICCTCNVEAAPFTFLQPGFTQEVYGVAPHFMGGVAFAPDGDVWVDQCTFSGSPLTRFDAQTTIVVNGTTVHPQVPGSPFASNAGCGLTNHPDGTLYSNLGGGVVNLDANTGAVLRGPFGPGGNALGIATDPQTGNLVYVGNNGTIYFVNQAFTASGVFSGVTTNDFVDGIFFESSGNFLFCANRSFPLRLTIIRRDGSLVQHVNMTSEPDGIAFRATTPKFVVTNNTDGTMTRFDFPGDDYTQVPTVSLFASGGFRGDLSQVGSDGCLYLTQMGTRYDDNTISSDNSIVRICGGFVPPIGVPQEPGCQCPTDSPKGCISGTVTVSNDAGAPIEGVIVRLFSRYCDVKPPFKRIVKKLTARTDSDGCFIFSDLIDGRYDVYMTGRCGNAGGGGNHQYVNIINGGKVNDVNFECMSNK